LRFFFFSAFFHTTKKSVLFPPPLIVEENRVLLRRTNNKILFTLPDVTPPFSLSPTKKRSLLLFLFSEGNSNEDPPGAPPVGTLSLFSFPFPFPVLIRLLFDYRVDRFPFPQDEKTDSPRLRTSSSPTSFSFLECIFPLIPRGRIEKIFFPLSPK